MSRLIDANKMKKDILDIYEQEFPTATGIFDRFVTEIVPSIINMQPTVDAVEVVRCKDCERRFTHDCPCYPQTMPEDWFCKDGW